jgi:hypothetical protein
MKACCSLRWPSLPTVPVPQAVGEHALGRQTLPPASATPPQGGQPVGQATSISQLLSLRTELSPFPWQCRRENCEKNE